MPSFYPRAWLIFTALALAIVFILSLSMGRYPGTVFLSPQRLIDDELAREIVWNLRMPRALMAVLLGMSLAAGGVVLQTIFGNPLVEPGFLGVSQGAAFGAALGIVGLGNAGRHTQLCAILFAFLGLGLSWVLANRACHGGRILRLVLAGIAVSALFSSGLGILKYLADPLRHLPDLTFWLLGALSSVSWGQLGSTVPFIFMGLTVIYLLRWRLNLLSLDDAVSFSLSASPSKERALLLSAAVIASAAAISVCGIVGWIGLIVPHFARRLLGADTRYTIPAAMGMGGLFTLLCDDLARSLLPGEIPLGILTSLLGALFFMLLLMTKQVRIQR